MTELEFPYSPGEDLYDLESYYKMLDLYFQFSRKVGLPVQAENLAEERRSTEEEISRILRTECSSYTRKCSACGKELSWDYPFSICERCFEREMCIRDRLCPRADMWMLCPGKLFSNREKKWDRPGSMVWL